MKIYDLVMIVGLVISIPTFPMTGETIRALVTGGIFGVYIGWRFLNK